MYRPGDTLNAQFVVTSATGAAANADALPTAILTRNGVDTAEVVTVTSVGVGRYVASALLPASYVQADSVGVVVSAVVGGIASKAVVMRDVIEQPLLLTTPVPVSNTAGTVGDALNAARAQGFGKWTLVGTALTLFAADGVTAVRTFTIDSATAPTSRT